MFRKTSEKVNVKFVLIDSDYRKYSCELSEALNGKQEAEADLKAVSTQIKSKVAECEAKIQQLSSKLSCGYEYREVDCSIVYDFPAKVKRWERVDNKEVVKTVPISDEELQEEAELNPPPTGPADEAMPTEADLPDVSDGHPAE